ncbi:hypothetical protein K432DRAFT_383351 [Lepidopterella palustris CBS 459.81]|uniref:Uncharacterized protein n=1 Tax=Lepidopterella palustris CBS 459.81 TaxID=1314670 RepID=A0A8E2E8C2_9PEZI|nr:hypothetical protein K432DRAFT_383351 [Lepidopterella palustris CBS 459.81]
MPTAPTTTIPTILNPSSPNPTTNDTDISAPPLPLPVPTQIQVLTDLRAMYARQIEELDRHIAELRIIAATDADVAAMSEEEETTKSPRSSVVAPLSPLPASNIMHAGHTPLNARAQSLERSSQSVGSTPEEYLSGPLTLPLNPGDGGDETIPVRVLEEKLAGVAKEQEEDRLEGEVVREDEVMEYVVEVDGVLLKNPR